MATAQYSISEEQQFLRKTPPNKNPATAGERRLRWQEFLKWCPPCRTWQSRSLFFQSNYSYDGCDTVCKACNKAKGKKRYLLEAEKRKAVSKAAYHCNPAQSRDTGRQWRRTHPTLYLAQIRRASVNRRAREAQAAVVEHFTREEIFERVHWICQLCYKPVSPRLKYPDPLSASLDHVIPFAEGGNHSRQNCVLTHLSCNVSKQDRPLVQQQRLF